MFRGTSGAQHRDSIMIHAVVAAAITALIAAVLAADSASAARVLAVFPHYGYSHHAVFLPYLRALADRGHDVHVISHFAFSHPRITDIVVRGSMPDINNNLSFSGMGSRFGFYSGMLNLFNLYRLAGLTEDMFNVPAVRQLLDDRHATFDLVVAEHFNSEVPLGFAAKYRAPFVLFSSCPSTPWLLPLAGQPHYAAYRPVVFSGLPARMDFVQRLSNALMAYASEAMFRALHRPWSRRVLKERLGVDVPSLEAFASNVSLVLVNTHWTVNGASPTVPALREVGGIHIKPPEPLPSDIQQFIDEAEYGVIYFCMGSLLRGETFPAKKRQMFLNIFKKIPQRILWKWEGDELPGKPPNVMIRKWMPQRDILAHPNVKLFISHGGLLGTTEAVYEGVPMLSMPMFGDQMTNMKAVEDKGVALILDYGDLNEDDIFTKMNSILADPTFKQKAKELSDAFRDRPMSPLDTAVYWTEYVIRHKGAPHLRSAAVGMPWYQYYLIDVISVVFLAITTVCVIIYYLIFKIFLRLINKKTKDKQS